MPSEIPQQTTVEDGILEADVSLPQQKKKAASRPSRPKPLGANHGKTSSAAKRMRSQIKTAENEPSPQETSPTSGKIDECAATFIQSDSDPKSHGSEPEAPSEKKRRRFPARTRQRQKKENIRSSSAEPSFEVVNAVSERAQRATEAEPSKGNNDRQSQTPDGAEPDVLFKDLGLSEPVLKAVFEMGYMRPTPIQMKAIPVVLRGNDVLGVAQTGTGKTASFVLPLIENLSGSRARARMPRSLILEPTRELALQVSENLTRYGKYLRLNHALLIGGESMAEQRTVLNHGVDILIATPGRLIDLFDRGGLLLNQTNFLIIDEADRMLDMGFIPDIMRIVSLLPQSRQTLLFSATMAPKIRALADQFLTSPEEITVSPPSSVATTIQEALFIVDERQKRHALRHLLRTENVQNAIIFCNRKRDVDVLYHSLQKHGFAVGQLHGDLAQSLRFKILESFKANEIQILVCSDVAARGIDIGGLSHVVNFDLPKNPEDYIHRIGRTGRAGKIGHAYSLASPKQKAFADEIEKLKKAPIPLRNLGAGPAMSWAEDTEETTKTPEKAARDGKNNGKSARQATRILPEESVDLSSSEKRASASLVDTFDYDSPRTGFGQDTPAFMLLPRRNRKRELDEQVGPIQHHGKS